MIRTINRSDPGLFCIKNLICINKLHKREMHLEPSGGLIRAVTTNTSV